MPSLIAVDYITDGVELGHSRITDLDILDNNGTPLLISSTRYDGLLESWDIATGTLARIDSFAFGGVGQAGVTPSPTDLEIAGNPGLFSGGGVGGDLQTLRLNANGTFGAVTLLTSLPHAMASFQSGITVALPDGSQAIFGSLAEEAGITRLTFSAAGILTNTQTFLTAPTSAVSALGAAVVDGQQFLFSANPDLNAVISWEVDASGGILVADQLDGADGLYIASPSVMQTVVLGGATYLILGASGSNSISVIEVAPDGSLTTRDHVLDGLDTRFASVLSLEVMTHDGRTYVVAAGSDDGLSVFMLLEGGRLIPQASIADTTSIGLDNISAIAMRGRGEGLDIFAASSSEPGLTQLRLETGPLGATRTAILAGGLLAGTTGNDILQGHDGEDVITGSAGDDIIRDGGGNDTLTGGAGKDIFILSRDGTTDVISDFTAGEDVLDLALWPFLRDISQLTFSLRSYGMDVAYGDERLIVYSSDGEFIDYRLLDDIDVIGVGGRIGTTIEPGYPGPDTPPPDLNPAANTPIPPEPGELFDILAIIGVASGSNFSHLRNAAGGSPLKGRWTDITSLDGTDRGDQITGTVGNDMISGGDGADILVGGAGHDIVAGGNGADVIMGGSGRDTLNGGNDGDLMIGGNDEDVLIGGSGRDQLYGGEDDDQLDGGRGDDMLWGEGGADEFIFSGGSDVFVDYVQGLDSITLGREIWTGLTSVEDVLFLYGSYGGTRATIDLGDGNILQVEGVTDYATFAQDIALF
ncbi:calcium-binding protein [Yoonia sediminilitoris]|uniref:Hemolysin type calcium-binding protein n=1 Tax=Yoonia sediminilitoris TaxID=1286148 RepID=A0A2T6KH75_9RHOB|nr:calcium-binding protein [Yoonia sediminilitoris]PUB14847.1 hemolysin type calcium-binding protein [Yoonia sediminilitoris]RCW95564.1 hemolysin type calcium-binding protein [Yoonia sediminilitoris]